MNKIRHKNGCVTVQIVSMHVHISGLVVVTDKHA